jgi:sodium-dependent phosphate transporter
MFKLGSNVKSTMRGMVVLTLLVGLTEFAEGERNMSFDKDQWTWLLVCAGLLAVCAAWGIGANDVANAFATSVGSGALTVKNAIILGAILEPLGAVLLGGKVMETMRKGISDYQCYQDNPALLMYGMTCVIMAVAVWLAVATYLKMPVSTTHSAVGGVIGMTLMTRGRGCVTWNYRPNQYCIKSNQNNYGDCQITTMGWDDFPWLDGVAEIVASWLISPIFSGICASILYFVTRYGVMERSNSYHLVLVLFPFIVGFTCWVNYIYIVLKGASAWEEDLHTVGQNREADEGNLGPVAAWGGLFAAIGVGVTACLEYFIVKEINRKVEAGTLLTQEQIHGQAAAQDAENAADGEKADTAAPVEKEEAATNNGGVFGFIKESMGVNALACVNEGTGDGNSEYVKRIHSNTKYYDPKTEEVFKYVQVFTAMVDSFSHGANDVANAMGPFAAVYFAWKDGYVDKKPVASNADAKWILLLGGLGMTLGLASYGYKIMQAIGVELIAVTPSRGYCIELGAAFVIIYGSSQGWPLSTTHCQVGATVFVGLFDGTDSVNGRELGIVVFGWVFTLLFVGTLTAILVGPSPDPIRGHLTAHDKSTVNGYCENYIPYKTQIAIGRGAPGYSLITPFD